MIKGYLTDKGFEAAVNAQQIYGGHGYIREWGMEQFVRDARIAQIYEGTNGIQALDLVGRKLGANGGRAIQAFFKLLGEEAAAAKADPRSVGRRLRGRRSEQRRRRPPDRDPLADAERPGQPQQCRRRAPIPT